MQSKTNEAGRSRRARDSRLTATALALAMQFGRGDEEPLWAAQQKALTDFFAKIEK